MAKDSQFVGFRVGRENYGIPIASVREIVRVPEITAVPDSPEFVEGVINLRGKIVPVVDLRRRFREPSIVSDRRNRVLVVEVNGKLIGLTVDAATEVVRLSQEQVGPPPDVFEDDEPKYVAGVGKVDDRLLILLDLEKVLQKGELKRLSDMPEAVSA